MQKRHQRGWSLSALGASGAPAYVNYMASNSPERVREVYADNYPRLARIKAKYDPANLFRVNQNIVPGGRV